ncbi:hypothetical protein METBIDRAFT_36171 [Metschnikowia bicuspidata var. bicuspidata NRRL YB-4993]|uniref:Uncharacterized protein n=1 Tax=Metschnikowia bicuspidata var. bicuspidata NRRL YB-4993 TaxID=869754 RepID=A0A1A0HJ02_9ASCO|nr:hypothetical protein METBIDRAFT_36171 [Metschnikowia bicuspidata var. bicuspidata NRRL YB-4993]OBA23818.1 hypothetical protein METBIDRAFT_36171 [Metschnikowia bicuspidata var. bicuspidata NRRL YB-4993]
MAESQPRVYPDSTNKWPTPFKNMLSSQTYPKWEPVDTAKQTKQVFKFGFFSVAGAYAWLYLWKRTTFKLELPMVVTGFATVAVAARGITANLREKNDGWNTFWAVAAGNAAVLTAGFKLVPLKHKLMTGISGACVSALAEQIMWAQSASSAGQHTRFAAANTDEELPKQEFWDVLKRRPMSQTVDALGVGRGIFKP